MVIQLPDILTLETAVIVASALLVSLIGATLAIAVRHKSTENWKPNLEDTWYYILSGSVGVCLAILGFGTTEIIAATTGINTPLAILKTALERRKNSGVTLETISRDLEIFQEQQKKLAEAAEAG